MTSVLYDAPGPRAKRRNVLLSVVFFVLLALVLWWVWKTMDDKGQLEWALWKPFTTVRGLDDLSAARTRQHPEGRGARHGDRPSAGRGLRHRPHVRPRDGCGCPAGVGGRVLPGDPGAAADAVRQRVLRPPPRTSAARNRPLYAVVTGLVLYNASVLAEIVRAGILSLPKGQTEAAYGDRSAQGPDDDQHPAPAGGHRDAAGHRQPAGRHREGHRAGRRDARLHRAAQLARHAGGVLRQRHPQLHRRGGSSSSC